LERLYPDLETYDERVSDRLEKMAIVKARGKGPPKKKRTREGEFFVRDVSSVPLVEGGGLLRNVADV